MEAKDSAVEMCTLLSMKNSRACSISPSRPSPAGRGLVAGIRGRRRAARRAAPGRTWRLAHQGVEIADLAAFEECGDGRVGEMVALVAQGVHDARSVYMAVRPFEVCGGRSGARGRGSAPARCGKCERWRRAGSRRPVEHVQCGGRPSSDHRPRCGSGAPSAAHDLPDGLQVLLVEIARPSRRSQCPAASRSASPGLAPAGRWVGGRTGRRALALPVRLGSPNSPSRSSRSWNASPSGSPYAV